MTNSLEYKWRRSVALEMMAGTRLKYRRLSCTDYLRIDAMRTAWISGGATSAAAAAGGGGGGGGGREGAPAHLSERSPVDWRTQAE